jgi:hypothetical protein
LKDSMATTGYLYSGVQDDCSKWNVRTTGNGSNTKGD